MCKDTWAASNQEWLDPDRSLLPYCDSVTWSKLIKIELVPSQKSSIFSLLRVTYEGKHFAWRICLCTVAITQFKKKILLLLESATEKQMATETRLIKEVVQIGGGDMELYWKGGQNP